MIFDRQCPHTIQTKQRNIVHLTLKNNGNPFRKKYEHIWYQNMRDYIGHMLCDGMSVKNVLRFTPFVIQTVKTILKSAYTYQKRMQYIANRISLDVILLWSQVHRFVLVSV